VSISNIMMDKGAMYAAEVEPALGGGSRRGVRTLPGQGDKGGEAPPPYPYAPNTDDRAAFTAGPVHGPPLVMAELRDIEDGDVDGRTGRHDPHTQVVVDRAKMRKWGLLLGAGMAVLATTIVVLLAAGIFKVSIDTPAATPAPAPGPPVYGYGSSVTATVTKPLSAPELQALDVELVIGTNIDFSPGNADALLKFRQDVARDVASSLRVNSSRICCVQLRAGSVIATFTLLPAGRRGTPTPTQLLSSLTTTIAHGGGGGDGGGILALVTQPPASKPANVSKPEVVAARNRRIKNDLAAELNLDLAQLSLVREALAW
jgi:hypothetical protein